MIVIDSFESPTKVADAIVDYSYRSFITNLDSSEPYLKMPLFAKYKKYCHEYKLPVGGRKGFFFVCKESQIYFMDEYK